MPLYRVRQLTLPLDSGEGELRTEAAKLLRLENDAIRQVIIERKSVDARDKRELKFVYGLLLDLDRLPRKALPPSVGAPARKIPLYEIPEPTGPFVERPIVIGSGPAGLFAALILAEAGLRPIVLERGDRVEDRHRVVRAFSDGAPLDPESNIQFGEGGAGTYSDGKLTTQVKDEKGRDKKVIAELLEAGAPEEIKTLTKPHLGTDKLIQIVANIRRKIEALGGEVRFRNRVDSILVSKGRLSGVLVNGSERIETDVAILAPGHSARDTFSVLTDLRIAMERKAFAIGLRIEHPQEMISRAQFGPEWRHPALPVADYKLAAKTADGRGVYSFCMCPGGKVVNSSSEKDGIVCNGMSDFARDGINANAAIVVSVTPDDFGSGELLAGVEFQRHWEQRAFAAGGDGHALPVQLFEDFCAREKSSSFGEIRPSATSAYKFAELGSCLPTFVSRGIVEGISQFGKSIEGFDRGDAVLTGVETRTSSPIRILRNEKHESSLPGLFPSGEGAGYAGGIMSAAMDGIRVAEQVIRRDLPKRW